MSNKKQNTPFYEGGDYNYNAVLSWGPPTWYNHIEGFYQSAHHIAKNMMSGGSEAISIDSGVFPMMFLYRHYIELSLKAQLWKMYDARRFFHGVEWNCDLYDNLHGHRLHKLFTPFKSEFNFFWSKALNTNQFIKQQAEISESMQFLEKICTEIDTLDQGSIGSRYPINKKWESYYTGNDRVNIMLFVDAMQKVREFLTGADDELEATLEALRSL